MFLLDFLYQDDDVWFFWFIHSLLILLTICIEYMNNSVQPRNTKGLRTDTNRCYGMYVNEEEKGLSLIWKR